MAHSKRARGPGRVRAGPRRSSSNRSLARCRRADPDRDRNRVGPCERSNHSRVEAAARRHLPEEDFAASWLHGQGVTLDELITAPPTSPSASAALNAVEPGSLSDPQGGSGIATAQRLRIRALGACTVHRGEHLLTATTGATANRASCSSYSPAHPRWPRLKSEPHCGPTLTVSNFATPSTLLCETYAVPSATQAGFSTRPAATPSIAPANTAPTSKSSKKASPPLGEANNPT